MVCYIASVVPCIPPRAERRGKWMIVDAGRGDELKLSGKGAQCSVSEALVPFPYGSGAHPG